MQYGEERDREGGGGVAMLDNNAQPFQESIINKTNLNEKDHTEKES